MAESFKLSSNRTQTINLGCGTLILIALIVAIFSNSGSKDVERGLDDLRRDVQELKKSIDAQSQQIRDLHDVLKKREPAPKAAEAVPKNPFELEAEEPQKKSLP
jgi:cell division protein FtsL